MNRPKGSPTSSKLDDPELRKKLFSQTVQQVRKDFADPDPNPIRKILKAYQGRAGALARTVAAYAKAGKAECTEGCAACCYQMVLCTPFEVFHIAQSILTTVPAEQLDKVKARLQVTASLPLDVDIRYDRRYPCGLLENNRCSVYERRPTVCRTLMSASRSACERCLDSKSGDAPIIAEPLAINAMMQMAIDYVLIAELKVKTDWVELSRALLMVLNDFEGVLTAWMEGKQPFSEAITRPAGSPPNEELVRVAAANFGVK